MNNTKMRRKQEEGNEKGKGAFWLQMAMQKLQKGNGACKSIARN